MVAEVRSVGQLPPPNCAPSPARVDGRRGALPFEVWRAGRLKAPGRLSVLLACGFRESDGLRSAWVGQAVDVEHCEDLAAALVLVGQSAPDMVVVGHSTRAFGPVEFLLALRQVDTGTPVVVGIEDSRLWLGPNVLAAGATVVVRRPFAAGDLLKLLESGVPSGGRFRIRPLPIDLGRLRIEGAAPRMWVDGVERVVPPMEFMLLRHLAERHGEIVSREELVCAGWGDRATLPSNSLSVHMTRLRRRFREPTGQDWIKALRGFGYRLLVPERPPARAAAQGASSAGSPRRSRPPS